jgi:hypothetical protein
MDKFKFSSSPFASALLNKAPRYDEIEPGGAGLVAPSSYCSLMRHSLCLVTRN